MSKIVKASDPTIIHVFDGYYFDPITNEVFSHVANGASVDNLHKLKPRSTGDNTVYRIREIQYTSQELHDWFKDRKDTKYLKIMASKTSPQQTSPSPTIETPKFEKVSDWRTLKVGDRIKTDDPATNVNEVVTVIDRERVEYEGHWAIKIELDDGSDTFWINTFYQINKQAPIETPKQESPIEGWVIMELDSGGGLTSLDDSGSIDVYKSEDDAFRFLKQLCDTHHNTTFVKLKIENFGVTTSTPTFHLT